MNIWDSVHRSLDKASKEAGRIARAQRLRSQIDKVTHQINAQEGTLLHQVMNLFMSGKMTQTELLPLCRELINLQQQLSQAQSELQMLQSQGPLPPQIGPAQGQQEMNTPPIPTTMVGDIAPTNYIPSSPVIPYQPFEATIPATPPPPPPPSVNLQTLHSQETIQSASPTADALTVSAQETIHMQEGTALQHAQAEIIIPATEAQQNEWILKQCCPKCNIETLPGHSFCQNCGTALLPQENSYQPTARASGSSPSYYTIQETAFLSPTPESNEPLHTDSPPPEDKGAATVYSVPPPPPNISPEEKDGGQ